MISESGAYVVAPSTWGYVDEGVISGVEPFSGQVGTRVTLTGDSLFGGGSAIIDVTFNGVSGSVLAGSNDSFVVVRASSTVNGTGDIVLFADTGAEVSGLGQWTHLVESVITDVVQISCLITFNCTAYTMLILDIDESIFAYQCASFVVCCSPQALGKTAPLSRFVAQTFLAAGAISNRFISEPVRLATLHLRIKRLSQLSSLMGHLGMLQLFFR